MGASLHAALPALSYGVCVPAHGAAKVHSVFERAANLELAGQRLVVLLDATCPNVPHGIRLASSAWYRLRASLRVGDALELDPHGLWFTRSGARVDLSAAHRWQVDLAGTHADRCDAGVGRGLAAVSAVAHAVHARTGDPVAAAYSRRLARVQPPLESAIRALRADHAIEQLHRLLGLGCGLTPSGDDFIVGCLAGLAIGTRNQPERSRFLMDVTCGLDNSATTLISRQHLSDACHLEFAQPLAELAIAIGIGSADALSKLDAALAVGASSGADGVQGLLFALNAWPPQPYPASQRRELQWRSAAHFEVSTSHGHAA